MSLESPVVCSLYYQHGSSDKVYNVQLWPVSATEWEVRSQYGRRGSRLVDTTPKRAGSYSKAFAEYQKLVLSKEAKGYRHGTLSGKSLDTPPSFAKALEPFPVWEGFETLYAETATYFGMPSTLSTRVEPAIALLSCLSLSMQDGLPDAIALVTTRTSSLLLWAEIYELLDEDVRQWFKALPSTKRDDAVAAVRNLVATKPRAASRAHSV